MSIPPLTQIWEIDATSSEQDLSFDSPSLADTSQLVWKLDLPESSPAAERELESLEGEIQSANKVLEEIPHVIERIGHQRSKSRSGDLSFQLEQLPAHEAELFDLLNELSPSDVGLSFGFPGKSKLDLQKAAQEFENFLDRVKKMLTHFALVETSVQGKVIGRTLVSWSGKTESSWQSTSSTQQFYLHERSLQAALASRYLVINMVVISAQSAARLSALLAIPGGAVLALPAVWRYITRILNQLEKYQTLIT